MVDNHEEFRDIYLKVLDSPNAWVGHVPFIILDFSNVERLGPSWANEAFAYFTKYGDPSSVLEKIQLKNISRVKLAIINQ